MSTQPIDYDALAQQHGGTATVDYDALAAQHGGTAAESPKAPDDRSFLEKAATQPSQFSHANPLRYFDELGQGMAQGVQALQHPIDTATKIYQTATAPHQHDPSGDVPLLQGLDNVADTIAQSYGQTATMAGAGKVLGASKDLAVGGAKRAALLGRTPEGAYESALKPSTTIPDAKRASIVQTGLNEGIPVSKAGLDSLNEKLSDLQDAVSARIKAGAGAGVTVDPFKVAGRLAATEDSFRTQVNPEADINAVASSGNEFLRNNPNQIPADQAQAMKQGTYRQLGTKAYGEMGTATMEAQKALARGIKEELASQIPEINDLNARESALYDLQPVLERAVNRISNHQLVGIGTPIVAGAAQAVTGSAKIGAVAGFLKAVLDDPNVKSRLAISMSKGGNIPPGVALEKINAYQNALAGATVGSAARDQSQP